MVQPKRSRRRRIFAKVKIRLHWRRSPSLTSPLSTANRLTPFPQPPSGNPPQNVFTGPLETTIQNDAHTSDNAATASLQNVPSTGTATEAYAKPEQSITVTVPKDSTDIVICREDDRFYKAKPNTIPLPEEMKEEWKIVQPQARKHIGDSTARSLPPSLPRAKRIIELDLLMVGEAESGTNEVELKPTVWIRCASEESRRAVIEQVRTMKYLNDFSVGKVQINLGAPR